MNANDHRTGDPRRASIKIGEREIEIDLVRLACERCTRLDHFVPPRSS